MYCIAGLSASPIVLTDRTPKLLVQGHEQVRNKNS
jgi:hypothetical protein